MRRAVVVAGAAAHEPGQAAPAEGTEDHDGAADHGQAGFRDGEGVRHAGLPVVVGGAEDPGDGPDPRGGYHDGGAAYYEKACEEGFGSLVDLEFYEHGDWKEE